MNLTDRQKHILILAIAHQMTLQEENIEYLSELRDELNRENIRINRNQAIDLRECLDNFLDIYETADKTILQSEILELSIELDEFDDLT